MSMDRANAWRLSDMVDRSNLLVGQQQRKSNPDLLTVAIRGDPSVQQL